MFVRKNEKSENFSLSLSCPGAISVQLLPFPTSTAMEDGELIMEQSAFLSFVMLAFLFKMMSLDVKD